MCKVVMWAPSPNRYGYFAGDDDAEKQGGFSGVLQALDFGSGRERGMTASARERYAARERAAEAERPATALPADDPPSSSGAV